MKGTTFAQSTDISSSYEWEPLKTNRIVNLQGMDIHPTKRDLMYAYAGYAGAFRWNTETSAWERIITTQSMPAEYASYGLQINVSCVVSAPSDANVVYLLDTGFFPRFNRQIFKSTDQGHTWTVTQIPNSGVKKGSLSKAKHNKRLSIDPINSQVVYYNSEFDGSWVTYNAGKKWKKITNQATDKDHDQLNIFSTVFSPTGGALEMPDGSKRTKVIFTTLNDGQVYRSTDAGNTWEILSDKITTKNQKPTDSTIGKDGVYYILYEGSTKLSGSAWKYTAENQWINITPENKSRQPVGALQSIAIDPFNTQRVVITTSLKLIYQSEDQGTFWSIHELESGSPSLSDTSVSAPSLLRIENLFFDPQERHKLWASGSNGVWYTHDSTAKTIIWHSATNGIETITGTDIIAPPGGTPVGASDLTGLVHFNEENQTTPYLSLTGNPIIHALESRTDNSHCLAVISKIDVLLNPDNTTFSYTSDGGKTWTEIRKVNKPTFRDVFTREIFTLSPTNSNNMLWLDKNGYHFYSKNRGTSWEPCVFDDPISSDANHLQTTVVVACADRVEEDTFYVHLSEKGLYRSTNGGANFTPVNPTQRLLLDKTLKATPGHARHLWCSTQSLAGNALMRSTNGGESWERMSQIVNVKHVAFGKTKHGIDGYPTLYVLGTVVNKHGIYRSTDKGESWDKITDYPMGIYDIITGLDGDKEEYGTVYISFSNTGFARGKILKE